MLCSTVLGLKKRRSAGAGLLVKDPAWATISLLIMVTHNWGSSSPADVCLRKVQVVLGRNKTTVQTKREYPLSSSLLSKLNVGTYVVGHVGHGTHLQSYQGNPK